MNKDDELVKQLQGLPNQAQAPDRWQQIQQAIESDAGAEPLQPEHKNRHTFRIRWGLAVAACALLIAAMSPIYLDQEGVIQDSAISNQTVISAATDTTPAKTVPSTYQLTIGSLQQANASYYAKLGYMVSENGQLVSPETLASLDSLRDAQQQYRHALAKNPDSGRLQQRLYWLYQKERTILRQLVV
ncbi:hypothetical protein [Kangiella marina]|uniref:Anti sigma-E protein RseA N-terminal domain-containing protein n=1 Tax=Kangiella marina TaxID=1079178 RepID=A0ABP8ILU7_9GAMM